MPELAPVEEGWIVMGRDGGWIWTFQSARPTHIAYEVVWQGEHAAGQPEQLWQRIGVQNDTH